MTDPDQKVVVRAIELAIGMPAVDLLVVTESRDAVIVETAAWALGERGAIRVAVVARLAGARN